MKSNPVVPIKYPYKYVAEKGLTKDLVIEISKMKDEPDWMLNFRLKSLEIYKNKERPDWGVDLKDLDLENLSFYQDPFGRRVESWDDIPNEIKETYNKLGIPQAERKVLAGASAQLESEVVYKRLREQLDKKGVVFLDSTTALKRREKLFKKHFAKLIQASDNKFAALNSVVWSGGSFIYVPKGVSVTLPIQAFFLINSRDVGQFERTIIIADEGSFVHYIEGCTAPIYSTYSLHAAVVEVFVEKNARVRYTTVQNWSKNIYNLTTKRAKVDEGGVMEWVDANIGSTATMKYPSCILAGEGARGDMLSISYAGEYQHQDVGAKMIHVAPKTSSRIISKAVSKSGGRNSYRGLVKVLPSSKNSSSYVSCDSLILDRESRADTYPEIDIKQNQTNVQHEAIVKKIDEEKLFYLESRGIKQKDAETLLVSGFIEPIVKEIPLEYAVEMNRLIEIEMEGSVG